jgi:aarF domain-containing kinase
MRHAPQIQSALERVRAGADVMPRSQLEGQLVGELGPDWAARLASFDWTPRAAASIGQVHAATLHDGTAVALKVQYPGVARSIESDVDNLMRLISIANILPKGLYVENAVKVRRTRGGAGGRGGSGRMPCRGAAAPL